MTQWFVLVQRDYSGGKWSNFNIILSEIFPLSLSLITKDRRFWPLFWTQFLGAANDNFFKNALVMMITYNSIHLMGMNSAALVALAGGIFILPYVTFSATAGQIADHYDKAQVIRVTKITELVIMLIAAVGFFLSSYGLLLVVLFLMGAQSSFFSPVKFGMLPEILDEDELTLGNAYIGGGTFLAILIGTILGGLSASLPGANIITGIGVVIVSALGIWSAWYQRNLGDNHDGVKIDYTFVKPTFDIISRSFKEKKTLKAIIGISWFWLFGAALLSILPALCKELFQGSETVGTMFMSTFTIGMGLGSIACSKFSGKRVEVGMVPLAAVGMSLFLLDLFWVCIHWDYHTLELLSIPDFFKLSGSIRAIFDLTMVTIFGGMFIIPQQAYMQRNSEPEYLARTIAANNIWNSVGMVVAAVTLMVLHSFKVTLPQIVGLIALANLCFAYVMYRFYTEEMWRFIAAALCKLMYNLKVEGEVNIPSKGPMIIASNHVTFVDWLFIMAVSPRPIRWVIDHVYFNLPILKTLFKHARLIPVATKKENPEVLEQSFGKMFDALENGECLGLFPEGFLTRDGKLRKFQPGIKKIVDQTKTEVIPVVINGAWGSFFSHEGPGVFKGFSFFKRRTITLKFLPTMHPEDFCFKDLEDLIAKNYCDFPRTADDGADFAR